MSSSASKKKGGLIKSRENLFAAIKSFVTENCHVKSSILIDAVVADIGGHDNLDDAFREPLSRSVFDMPAALNWLIFLREAPKTGTENGDAAIDAVSSEKALRFITSLYDLEVEDIVTAHFEDEEEEEEEEE